MQIYGYFLFLFLKVEVITKIMKVEINYCCIHIVHIMSVNDLHWPEFKCYITIHLQWTDLNVTLTLVFQHIVSQRIKVR